MIIKLFENFDESLYTVISEDDWDDFDTDSMAIDISIAVANKIYKIIDKENYELRRSPLSRIDYSSNKIIFYSYLNIRAIDKLPWEHGYVMIEIFKDHDDYYWVKMETSTHFGSDYTYFKCDQDEGLVELFESCSWLMKQ